MSTKTVIKPNFPYLSLLFWSVVLVLIAMYAGRNSIGTYAYGFIPVHLISIVIRFFYGKIIIDKNILFARVVFDKFEIDLDKVRSFKVKKRNVLIQIIAGIPKEVTIVEYNKYNTLQLNSADPVLVEVLSRNKAG